MEIMNGLIHLYDMNWLNFNGHHHHTENGNNSCETQSNSDQNREKIESKIESLPVLDDSSSTTTTTKATNSTTSSSSTSPRMDDFQKDFEPVEKWKLWKDLKPELSSKSHNNHSESLDSKHSQSNREMSEVLLLRKPVQTSNQFIELTPQLTQKNTKNSHHTNTEILSKEADSLSSNHSKSSIIAPSTSRASMKNVLGRVYSIELQFEIEFHAQFGTTLAIIGNIPEFGSWNTEHRDVIPQLQWNSGNIWKVSVTIEFHEDQFPFQLEYKYLVLSDSMNSADSSSQIKDIQWENGLVNHLVAVDKVDGSSSDRLSMKVHDCYGNPSLDSKRILEVNREFKDSDVRISDRDKDFLSRKESEASIIQKIEIVLESNEELDVKYGDSVYISGSISQLGYWNPLKAVQMEYSQSYWTAVIEIPLQGPFEFEYSYFISSSNLVSQNKKSNKSDKRHQTVRNGPDYSSEFQMHWECTSSKLIRRLLPWLLPHKQSNGEHVTEVDCSRGSGFRPGLGQGFLRCVDMWRRFNLKFSIFFPMDSSQQSIFLTGDPIQIGAWFRPGPVPMSLGPKRIVHTEVEGRAWEFDCILRFDQIPFDYRYVLFDAKTGLFTWEREPNRSSLNHRVKCGSYASVTVINGCVEFRDTNFVAGFEFDFCPPSLFIGPYPQSASDIQKLAQSGIKSVLNVQTDEDFSHRQVNWNAMESQYKLNGIHVVRYPIQDFDRQSLLERLPQAAQIVSQLVEQYGTVLIHCTAGMGRATAVAVAYLVSCCGWKLDHALSHVKFHRNVAAPNEPALRQLYS